MNKYFFFLLLIVCTNTFSQQSIDKTITHDGLTREYRLYIPASYNANTAVPLVFNLHGYGSNNAQQDFYGNFKPIADTANFIICLPNGTLDQSNTAFWNVGFAASNVDDVGFISTLITEISATYNIDPTRVYSTGMSNGGFMSYSLACQLSDRIAAIASVTGTMTSLQQGNCSPNRTVPIMQIHGTEDPTVPYTGSNNFLHIDTLVNNWVIRNGCTGSPTITNVPNSNTTDGATAQRFDYDNCQPGGKVAFYKVQDGEHTWPGASIAIGVTCMDFSASLEIWKFFLQFTHPNPTIATSLTEKENKILNIYPNPANNLLQIEIANKNITSINIFDISGKQQLAFTNNNNIDVSSLINGVYFISVKFADGGLKMERFIKE